MRRKGNIRRNAGGTEVRTMKRVEPPKKRVMKGADEERIQREEEAERWSQRAEKQCYHVVCNHDDRDDVEAQ
eukprot:1214001-Amorphochlora_amoeboformis.AAC.1